MKFTFLQPTGAGASGENKNSGEYWLSRAKYYAGRREDTQAIEAFEKALDLTPFDLSDASRVFKRRLIFSDYLSYKAKSSGEREAVQLVRREFDAIRLDSEYATWLVNDLLWKDSRWLEEFLRSGDDRLWAYLAAKAKWGHAEERLLRRMVENVPRNERDAFWTRAGELAATTDPTRAWRLGWIMTRTDESARAISLLRNAVERLPDGDDKKFATFALFEASLDTTEWQGAQALWPLVRQHLGPREIPDWLGKIAVTAAKAGAADDAMHLWHTKANLDRCDFRHLDELARVGLKERLRDFYQRMKRDDPLTWAPEAALRRLQ